MGAHLLHYLILLLLGLGFAVATAELSPPGWNHTILTLGLSLARAEKFANPASDRQTSQFARLRNVRGPVGRNFPVASVAPKSPLTQASSSTASTSKKTATVSRSSPFQNISAVNAFSTQYAIDCSWDGAPVSLIFDTGSADTWVAGLDLSCQDHAGHTHDRATCGFGGPSVDGFSHGAIDNVHFSLRYGSGETVSGPMGYSDISCGGLSVSHQQVGLANQTHWRGDNITAGILGLAQPSLTSAFYGPVGDEAPRNSAAYSTFIATAISQGSMDPMFSVAILKDSAGGVLAWGGLPPIAYDHTKMAAVDLLIARFADDEATGWKPSFYTIVPDGMRWGSTTDSANYPYIVDTGTTQMHLPPPLAEYIAAAFDPPAEYVPHLGSYLASCDAVPPRVGVVIGGVEFDIRPGDLIYPDIVDPRTELCAVAIANGGAGPYILGDVFLQNVLAVFDVGAGQMRFYGRGELGE